MFQIFTILEVSMKSDFQTDRNISLNAGPRLTQFWFFYRVHLIRADKLMKKDIGVLGMGKSDPYAVLQVGAKKVQTNVINNTISPEWNFVADFPIEVVKGQQLSMELFDHDDPG